MPTGAQQGGRPHECMFPWTMVDEKDAEGESESQTAPTDGAPSAAEQATDERPLACRAWCVEHAEEP